MRLNDLDPQWHPTGRLRKRRTWLGVAVLELEEQALIWRPRFTCYTPANWALERRWRRMTLDAILAERERFVAAHGLEAGR